MAVAFQSGRMVRPEELPALRAAAQFFIQITYKLVGQNLLKMAQDGPGLQGLP